MIAIADNLNTRNKPYMDALNRRDAKPIVDLVKKLTGSGADMINIQCSLDGTGDEEALPWVTEILSGAVDCQISLDSRNIQALTKTIPLCKKPPLINYISKNEPEGRRNYPFFIRGKIADY